MIGRLSGTLADKAPPQILLDCQSVGYEVDVPMSTFCKLPAVGEQVVLLTHLIVREDGHFLFGFLTSAERRLFRCLLKVSGIGARIALAVLSGLSVEEFYRAIALEDATTLTRIPGIGRKTAERMLLELRGNLPSLAEAEVGGKVDRHDNVRANVIHALLALGYKEREAQAAVNPLPADVSLDEGLRLSLKNISRL